MATIFQESFETDGNGTRYTLSIPEFTGDVSAIGAGDYFTRSDDISPVLHGNYLGADGDFFFAANDTNGDSTGLDVQSVLIEDIDISGFTNLSFSGLFAEQNQTDRGNGGADWDADSLVYVEVSIDDGPFVKLLQFAATGENTPVQVDTDLDGVGDGPFLGATAGLSLLEEHSASIAGTGNLLDLRITFENLQEDDEDMAIDNVRIIGTPEPQFSMEGDQLVFGNFLADTQFGVVDTVDDLVGSSASPGVGFSVFGRDAPSQLLLGDTVRLIQEGPSGILLELDLTVTSTNVDGGLVLLTGPSLDQFLLDGIVILDAPLGSSQTVTLEVGPSTPPNLIASSPENGDVSIGVGDEYTLTFDEPVQAGAGVIRIHRLSDDVVLESFDVTSDVTFLNADASFTPTSLPGGTQVYVTVDPGAIRDLDGNPWPGIPGPTELSFSTNQPPVTTDSLIITQAGITETHTFTAVDPEGDPLSFALETPPGAGSASVGATGLFTYTAPSQTGTEFFTYLADDGLSGGASARVDVEIVDGLSGLIRTGTTGNDVVRTTTFNDSIAAADGDDLLIVGTGGDDSVGGGNGDDIFLLENASALSGGVSNTFSGEADDDMFTTSGAFEVQGATVSIAGGLGQDILAVAASSALTATSGALISVSAGAEADTFDIDGDLVGSAAVINLSGDGGEDVFDISGNTTITAASGGLNIDGGTEDDTISLTGSLRADQGDVVVDGGLGNDTIALTGPINILDTTVSVVGDAGLDRITLGGQTVSMTGDATLAIDAGDDGDTISITGSTTFSGGSVQIDGGAGNDSILGSAIPELVVDAQVDWDGGADDDTLTLALGDITISGSSTINLSGGEGEDALIGVSGDISVTGAAQLNLSGDGGDDVMSIISGSGVSISGGAFSADGGAGNDTILGTEDTLDVVSGTITVAGGDDDDTIWLSGQDSVSGVGIISVTSGEISIDGGRGQDVVELSVSDGTGVLPSIALGSSATIRATGGDDDDTVTISTSDISVSGGTIELDGGAGNDTVTGSSGSLSISSGDVSISGGDGEDIVEASSTGTASLSGTASLHADGGGDDDLVVVSRGSVTVTGGEIEIGGGSGNDTVAASSGGPVLLSGASITIDGGDDDDLVLLSDSAVTVTSGDITLSGGTGSDTIRLTSSTALISAGVGISYLGGGGSDFITGTDFGESFDGGTGIDIILAGGGDDDASGGADPDAIDGGAGNDTLSGEGGEDLLLGGANDDVLYGGDDDDVLIGADGTDAYFGGDGVDTVQFFGNAALTIDMETPGNNTGEAAGEVFFSIENIIGGSAASNTFSGTSASNTLTGGQSGDSLSGRGGNDLLLGGVGNDTLDGGLGDDTFFVDSVDDVVIEDVGEGFDRIYTTVTLDPLAANVEAAILLGTASLDLTGNDQDNWLIGNSGDNVLAGGLGRDRLNGGAGNDTLVSDAGNDLLEGGAGADVFRLTLQTGVDKIFDFEVGVDQIDLTLVGDQFASLNILDGSSGALVYHAGGLLVLDGISASALSASDFIDAATPPDPSLIVGTSDDDILFEMFGPARILGLAGNDYLAAFSGSATLEGGAGDDVYYVYEEDTTLIEAAGDGFDRVYTTVDLELADNIEDVRVTGDADVAVTGNADINWLVGNSGANALVGEAGADRLIGLDGMDTLIGGAENDVLEGGADADAFVFSGADGIDRILDFELGTDLVRFSSLGLSFNDLTVSDLGGAALVDYGFGLIRIENVSASALTEDTFDFANG
ncbi:MAG: Ig-like domain-containing protein [Pseudomonadota bacterium]